MNLEIKNINIRNHQEFERLKVTCLSVCQESRPIYSTFEQLLFKCAVLVKEKKGRACIQAK